LIFSIVANGGTTAQLVPIITRLAEETGRNSVASDDWTVSNAKLRAERRGWRWEVWDVQRNGVTQLVGDIQSS